MSFCLHTIAVTDLSGVSVGLPHVGSSWNRKVWMHALLEMVAWAKVEDVKAGLCRSKPGRRGGPQKEAASELNLDLR